jgi:hypothetical protein
MVLRAGELGYKIWTRSADHHTGQRLLKMPHIKGLTEDRTRSHIQKVRNFLHNGRQPQKNHRFPPEIIAVWLYYRFPLSLRHVEEMLLE